MSGVAAFRPRKARPRAHDHRLFDLALTHASVGGESYERLEFLGDRVLGMVIARALYERYPDGARRQSFAPLQCAGRARDLRGGRPRARHSGAGPARQAGARGPGARQSENVVGDVVEALIGALLLDGGLGAAERSSCSAWGAYLDEQVRAPEHPKSALQELAAARGLRAPVYEVVSRTGAHHAPLFTIRVSVAKLGEATAEGSSKQDAETAAAEALLASSNDARRLRRRHRRPQRRQIDAGQCAGRPEGRDRQRQGADHARAADGDCGRGRGADPAGRHARHLRAAAPARPGDGRRRLDRRRGCRPHPAGDRFRCGHNARRSSGSSPGSRAASIRCSSR